MTGVLFFCGCSADIEVDNSKSTDKRKSVEEIKNKEKPKEPTTEELFEIKRDKKEASYSKTNAAPLYVTKPMAWFKETNDQMIFTRQKLLEAQARISKIYGNYERLFGSSAIYRLKRDLPEPSAQVRIDTALQSFKMMINLPQGTDPAGVFAGIESKAYQLADRMEEEAMLKRLEETLIVVKRLVARR